MAFYTISFNADTIAKLLHRSRISSISASKIPDKRSHQADPGIWLVINSSSNVNSLGDQQPYFSVCIIDGIHSREDQTAVLPLQSQSANCMPLLHQLSALHKGEPCMYSLAPEDLSRCLAGKKKFLMIDIFSDHIEFCGIEPYGI
ncbi:hypothetical protein [Thauera sp. 28]|uniref:hypothetical protein n=1 Tax=Thauera sp. 28 TaxID=303682 RepID=UPI0012F73E78|nr:hypothetical protein [Thauera sp. 28]